MAGRGKGKARGRMANEFQRGAVWRGLARRGLAGHGKARQGKARRGAVWPKESDNGTG